MIKKREHKKEEKHDHEIKEGKKQEPLLTLKIPKSTIKSVLYVLAAVIAIVVLYLAIKPILTGNVPFGNNVKISYSVEDENGGIIAQGENSFVLGGLYETFGLSSNKLDKAISSMKVDEEKIITLSPNDAYGEYDSTKLTSIERLKEINKTFTSPISVEDYKSNFNKTPKVGDSIPFTQYWNVTIIEYDNSTNIAKLRQEIEDDMTISLEPEGNISVSVSGDKIYLKYNPGKQMLVQGSLVNVVDVTENTILLDYNSPLVGKNIIIKVKLISSEKAEKIEIPAEEIPNAPVLDAFVVSYCPYGLQMQRILVPVAQLLSKKANIHVRYIGSVENGKVTAMHGEQEATENLRQICIREEQKDKFWGYISCFIKDGNSAECLSSNEIEKTKLQACMNGKGIDYAKLDFALAKQYSISSSPSLILGGKEANEFDFGGRNADAVKKLICSAFGTAPGECSESLSTAQAAGSFSATYSSSGESSGNATASCG